jgi:gamma-glutamyltranspeptidase/glutathione hydrolase
MVSAPHAVASAIGVDVLKRDGNAVDAAIAASAALMVTLPMQCGPGGDAFWIIGQPNGSISALDASGRSSSRTTIDDLRSRGLEAIPPRSAYSITVPGATDGWVKAHESLGSLPMEELLEPAAQLAENGFFASRHTVANFKASEAELRDRNALCLWSSTGSTPRLYERIRQPALAKTLRAIGKSSGRSVYEGALARSIAKAVSNAGGWLTEEDLGTHSSEWVDPIHVQFRDLTVFTTPASTQGFALLAALKRISVTSPSPLARNEADTVHLLVEAVGSAMQDRDAFNDDRSRVRNDLDGLWANASAEAFLGAFNPLARSHFSSRPSKRYTKGDTAHLAVVDRNGLSVSLIQSLFFDFGSCIPVPEGGFTLQNRGAAFHLDEGSHGALAPGVRPPSTLMPSMAMRDGKPVVAFGCMGGDGQMQTQVQFLVDIVDGRLDIQQAISRPRWYLDRSSAEECTLLFEAGVDHTVVAELRERGHRVKVLGRWEEIMGHVQAIHIEAERVLVGAADPRSDGQVAAV